MENFEAAPLPPLAGTGLPWPNERQDKLLSLQLFTIKSPCTRPWGLPQSCYHRARRPKLRVLQLRPHNTAQSINNIITIIGYRMARIVSSSLGLDLRNFFVVTFSSPSSWAQTGLTIYTRPHPNIMKPHPLTHRHQWLFPLWSEGFQMLFSFPASPPPNYPWALTSWTIS